MARTVQVVIPTYKRPDKLKSTIDQLRDREVIYVCHETDIESQKILTKAHKQFVIDYQQPSGVNATNRGFWATTADWIVIGQDDFTWHVGWLQEATRVQKETNAMVVGFSDGYRTDKHSVAWLIYRPYAMSEGLCIGFPNVIFNPHYKKNFSDNELNDTAKLRGVFAYAENAVLEHLHPSFGKSLDDSTYQHLEPYFEQDFALYKSRQHLWQ
jgi:glycosyltransferase involved in cell wall biosynthesis